MKKQYKYTVAQDKKGNLYGPDTTTEEEWEMFLAVREAQGKYQFLNPFHKLYLRVVGKDFWHINMEQMTAEEISNLYKGKKQK